MKYGFLKRLALLLLGVLALGSCTQTEVIYIATPDANEALVRFEVELPDVTTPSTRGIQTEDEAVVNNFYVLIFDQYDKFVDKKIIPRASVTSTNGSGSSANEIKTFTTALIKSDNASDLYNIVLLANVYDALKTAVDAIAPGSDRETVLTALKQTYAGNPAMPVPMASIPQSPLKIEEGMPAQTFSMIRMVARIDVKLAASVATSYSVRQVLFYNYNKIGRVWAKDYTGTAVDGIATLSDRGTAPAGSFYPVSNKLANSGAGPNYETDFEALLYAQEAVVNAVAARPCIVIELEDKSGVSQGFYRAEFFAASGSKTYLDILRNHRYLFNITAVHGTGFTNATDAYNSAPAGLTTDVISIDESEIKEIIVGGQYWLGLLAKNLELDYTAQTNNTIVVKTNASAWIVEGVYNDAGCTSPHSGAWLTSATKSSDNLVIAVTENQDADRTAYVKLKAGIVECAVTVVQKSWGGTLTISPSNMTLPYTAVTAKTNNLEVTSLDANGDEETTKPWTLTSSNPEWFLLTLNSDGSGAGTTVSGSGNRTVYTIATENTSTTATRTTTVTLNGTAKVAVNVLQLKKFDFSSISGGGTYLPDPYVGAFWRDEQTGERLIKMANPHSGAWSATLAWVDARWNEGDIVLMAGGSPDRLVYVSGKTPGDAEDYPVGGSATAVSGTGAIQFRIGLNDTYTSNSTYPARYAVVVVEVERPYPYTPLRMKIFLRQGENDDYLMRPTDPSTGDWVSATRPRAVKFSVFNITAQEYLDNSSSAVSVPVAYRGGVPVKYPTQSGALFEVIPQLNDIIAFNQLSGVSNIIKYRLPAYQPWATISSWAEACPPGYRRPSASDPELIVGYIDSYLSDANSEILQSLNNNSSNVLNGLYADGYFDRREIVSAKGSSYNVWTTTRRDAYAGYLLFNEYNNASLFFPAHCGLVLNFGNDETGFAQLLTSSFNLYNESSTYYQPISFQFPSSYKGLTSAGGKYYSTANYKYNTPSTRRLRCVPE